MKIAVVGGGAIGSMVAARLAQAGVDVLLVGRPDHVAAINRQGLVVKGHDTTETVRVQAATKMDHEYDLVIFATKTPDMEEAYQDNHQYLENARVLTTQNGVQGDNILRTHFEPENMFSSIVMFGATYSTPGEVIVNFPGDWIVGKPYTPNDNVLSSIVQVLGKAFPVVVSPNIMAMKWLKLFVNFNNCLPAVIGRSMQETFADKDFCLLSIRLLKEGVKVVQEAGIELLSLPNFPVERITGLAAMPEDQAAGIIQKTLTTLSKVPLDGSILQSIKRGKPSEIDFINGEVALVAKNIGVAAPLNSRIVEMVHEVERSGRFFSVDKIKKEFLFM